MNNCNFLLSDIKVIYNLKKINNLDMVHGIFNDMALETILFSSGLSVQLFGVFTVLTGFALRYWISRRRSNRRNMASGPHINSNKKKPALTLSERLMKLLGLVFILFGIFVILAGYTEWQHEPKAAAAKHRNIT